MEDIDAVKKKRKVREKVRADRLRQPLTKDQTETLCASFELDSKPTPKEKTRCSDATGLTVRQVTVWFANRRAKKRKMSAGDQKDSKSLDKDAVQQISTPQVDGRKMRKHRGKRARADSTPLSILFPHLVNEWDHQHNDPTLSLDRLTLCSNRIIHWKCFACSHEWATRLFCRTRGTASGKPHGCPKCKRFIASEFNALSTLHPDLAKEWHPTRNGDRTPDNVAHKSNAMFWWLCPDCGYEYQMRVYHRTGSEKCRCPSCSGAVVTSRNSLAALHPDIAAEWDKERNEPLTPEDVTISSGKRVHWICGACDKRWRAQICHRTRDLDNVWGCARCAKSLHGVGTSQTERLLVEAVRNRLRLPKDEDLQRIHEADPDHVSRVNARYGTGFHANRIAPDIHLKSDSHGIACDVFVEYDSMLHDDERHHQRDKAKSEILLHGARKALIRLREAALPSLDLRFDEGTLYAEIPVRLSSCSGDAVERVCDEIMALLGSWALLD